MRGATSIQRLAHSRDRYFNPRAPCGARPVRLRRFYHTNYISIHAPLAGRDAIRDAVANGTMPFQSTRPLRGATPALPCVMRDQSYFNPRAPCGARHHFSVAFVEDSTFQSTRPLRGATLFACFRISFDRISIHAPLAGRDLIQPAPVKSIPNFNPRAPCGARRCIIREVCLISTISIHAPLAGRDMLPCIYSYLQSDFNPRAPCGARRSRRRTARS